MMTWRFPGIRRHRNQNLSMDADIERLRRHLWTDPLVEACFGAVLMPSNAGSPTLAPGRASRIPISRHTH